MKIKYKKRHLNINLILGFIWLTWFFFNILNQEVPKLIDYGWLVISLLYFGIYFYQKTYGYLTIENEVITLNSLFRKKINLKDIIQVKKFAGDYILKTNKKELSINTKFIEPNALAELDAELDKLELV